MLIGTKLSPTAVAQRLREADFGSSLSACGFRFWGDEALGDVVEIVLILDHEIWDEAAISACENARAVADKALSDLPCFALPVCRTRTEHESFREREVGLWLPVEVHGAC